MDDGKDSKLKTHFLLASAFLSGSCFFLFFLFFLHEGEKRPAHLGSSLQLVFVLGLAPMRHQSKSNLFSLKNIRYYSVNLCPFFLVYS